MSNTNEACERITECCDKILANYAREEEAYQEHIERVRVIVEAIKGEG